MNQEMIQYYISETKKSFKEFKNKETRIKQVPNMLVFSRVISPAFVIPAAFTGHFALAGLLAVGFALTDAIDGPIARKHDAVTEFGKKIDPIADKILAAGLGIGIFTIQPIIAVNLALEAIIAGISINSELKGNNPLPTKLGKLKTILLSCLLGGIYLSTFIPPTILPGLIELTGALFLGTTAFQIATANQYTNIHNEKEIQKLEDRKRESEHQGQKMDFSNNLYQENIKINTLSHQPQPEIKKDKIKVYKYEKRP